MYSPSNSLYVQTPKQDACEQSPDPQVSAASSLVYSVHSVPGGVRRRCRTSPLPSARFSESRIGVGRWRVRGCWVQRSGERLRGFSGRDGRGRLCGGRRLCWRRKWSGRGPGTTAGAGLGTTLACSSRRTRGGGKGRVQGRSVGDDAG